MELRRALLLFAIVLGLAAIATLKFDLPTRGEHENPRYRYRIVYRLEPHEGSSHRVFVIAVAPKQIAYGEGTARAARRLRQLAKQRATKRINS